MADNPVNIERPVARGYRSKAINAVAGYAESVAPIAGQGIVVDQTAAGRRISVADRHTAAARSAWSCRVRLLPRHYGEADEWALDVLLGEVTGSDGAALSLVTAPVLADDETAVTLSPGELATDGPSGLQVATIVAPPPGPSWLCVARSGDDAETYEPGVEWALAWVPAASAPCGDAGADVAPLRRVPIASVEWTAVGAPPTVRALMPGVIHLGVAGPHFGLRGETAPVTSWSVDAGKPARLQLVTDLSVDRDGKPSPVYTDVRLDGRGNVYQVGDAPVDPDDPDRPAPVDPSAPPCGNPLNGPGGGGKDDNPLDNPHGGPGGGSRPDRDPSDNPLDHPGDGGYTPSCGG